MLGKHNVSLFKIVALVITKEAVSLELFTLFLTGADNSVTQN